MDSIARKHALHRDGQTDGQTDRQTDKGTEKYTPSAYRYRGKTGIHSFCYRTIYFTWEGSKILSEP